MFLLMIPGDRGNNVIVNPFFVSNEQAPGIHMEVSGPISQESIFQTVIDGNAQEVQSTTGENSELFADGVKPDGDLVGKQVIFILNTSSTKAMGYEQKNKTLQDVLDMLSGKKTGINKTSFLLNTLSFYIMR